MLNEIKRYDEMVRYQRNVVVNRKVVIEEILKDMDCNSYSSFTALTDAVAAKFTELKGEPMSGSTIRRKGSKYRSIVESYYNTKERVKTQFQNKESLLQEELMVTQLELRKTSSELNSTRKALQYANTEMDRLKLSDIESRTDECAKQEYSDKEVAAYKVLVELVKVCEDSGLDIDGYQITTIDFQGVKTLISQDKCPTFFKWYREQLKN
ncbi:hypothetical protein QFW85_14840 [Vibrio chagasii]|uniref:hypothetical protein n=1 Tax=Vibrio chagasii TaxID=170679 RepID=UPI0033794B95|nr:conserved hypothetical protein [Vibrio chagasii]CAH6909479.1 conserved hypothetical protein [Vibrio chagasii]